jgi:hypothetical protein
MRVSLILLNGGILSTSNCIRTRCQSLIAIETATLMLGSNRSRGYCLEMICADFLANVNRDHGDTEMLLLSVMRFKFLSEEQRQTFLEAWAMRPHSKGQGPLSGGAPYFENRFTA